MSKKSAPKKRKKRARKKKFSLSKYSILTTITIQSGNVIDNPDPLVVPPEAAVVWIVDNQDGNPHDVSIDPALVTHKNNGKKEHPFILKCSVLEALGVGAGQRGIMFALTRAGLKNDQYKYEIASTNGNGTSNKLDPDLDVVDPNSTRNT